MNEQDRELFNLYKLVYEYVINLDMQQEMLDMLMENEDLTDWGELYNAINTLRDIERGYEL